jgi:hypothetical protein
VGVVLVAGLRKSLLRTLLGFPRVKRLLRVLVVMVVLLVLMLGQRVGLLQLLG